MKTALLVVVALSFLACPKPTPPGPGEPKPPAQCSGHLIEQCAPQVLPLVNECLAGNGDTVGCVLAITRVVGCATYEILACVVRHEGDAAKAASSRNPGDLVDHRRAVRAQEFLDKTGARFAD